jgi:hypothetical protein
MFCNKSVTEATHRGYNVDTVYAFKIMSNAATLSLPSLSSPNFTPEQSSHHDVAPGEGIKHHVVQHLLGLRTRLDAGEGLTQQEWRGLAHYIENAFSGRFSDSPFAIHFPAHVSPDICATMQHINEVLAPSWLGGRDEFYPGRRFNRILYERKFDEDTQLNPVLLLYKDVLWKLVARGHYLLTNMPIRANGQPSGSPEYRLNVSEGEFSLEFIGSPDVAMLLNFPGSQGLMIDLGDYARIQDIRHILKDLDVTPSNEICTRRGSHYFAYTATGSIKHKVWLRIAMTSVGFTFEEWRTVQRLFEKAWAVEHLLLIGPNWRCSTESCNAI